MEYGELISVLMCVYNTRVDYLQQAIASILGQTYKNLEFIIVDDGSDKTETIECLKNNSLKDSRIKLIFNPKNVGLTKALNIGLKYCQGKYIARMDSDDVSLDTRISRQKEYMDAHLEVSILGSNIIEFGDGIESIDTAKLPDRTIDKDIYMIRSLLEHSGPPHPTFMIRAGFLRENGIMYREDILKAQDYALMVDCLKAGGTISKLRDSLLMYRIHAEQITAGEGSEQERFQEIVSAEYLAYVFKELSDEESRALATLRSNDYRYRCNIYVKAIKNIIKINRQRNLYNHVKFKREFEREWRKKVLRIAAVSHKLNGFFSFFTFKCLFLGVLS